MGKTHRLQLDRKYHQPYCCGPSKEDNAWSYCIKNDGGFIDTDYFVLTKFQRMKNKIPGRNVNFLSDSNLNRNVIIFSEKIDSQIRQALSCRKSILNRKDSFWGVDNYRWEWYHKKSIEVVPKGD